MIGLAVVAAGCGPKTPPPLLAASRRPGPLPRGVPPPEVWAVVVAL